MLLNKRSTIFPQNNWICVLFGIRRNGIRRNGIQQNGTEPFTYLLTYLQADLFSSRPELTNSVDSRGLTARYWLRTELNCLENQLHTQTEDTLVFLRRLRRPPSTLSESLLSVAGLAARFLLSSPLDSPSFLPAVGIMTKHKIEKNSLLIKEQNFFIYNCCPVSFGKNQEDGIW